MIYAVGQGNRKEMLLVEDELREQTAFRTDEQLNYIGLYTREEFETFIAEDSLADIICADITVLNGIGQLENGFLHSLRCVGAGKVFADFLHRERQIPVLRLFLLQHDTEDGIIIELTFAR